MLPRILNRHPDVGGSETATMPGVTAEPYEFEFDPKTSALLIIDMQRDFVDPGGFGEALGTGVSLLRRALALMAAVQSCVGLIHGTQVGWAVSPDIARAERGSLASAWA